MKSSIIIVYNPASREASEKKVRVVSEFFGRKGFETKLMTTRKAGDAEAFARRAAAEGPHMIIAGGGDGTINEVANALASSCIPMAIVPLGTTNVLAREIYSDRSLEGILVTISTKPPRTVSLGKITCGNGVNQKIRYFCLMAGIGFDGQTVRDVDLRLKKHTGPGAYLISGIKTLLRYSPPGIVLNIDGRDIVGYQAVIGKVSRYGGDFMVTPDARIEDPVLYACVLTRSGRLDLLRYIISAVLGSHLNSGDVIYTKTDRVVVKGEAAVQVDGDYFGMSPIDISVEKDALRLIY
ncbi:MAG: YegS/Rv2252/BmrU family lipid kinase [Nitrospirae bacterium]|nr:YegS/Rv2252/BmrU family lipid kinase [Nitrospirota bacterium]